jgi:hypothetical protein
MTGAVSPGIAGAVEIAMSPPPVSPESVSLFGVPSSACFMSDVPVSAVLFSSPLQLQAATSAAAANQMDAFRIRSPNESTSGGTVFG